MGGTSVTGNSGFGSAAGLTKGSDAMSLGVKKLIGPRIVMAGQTVIDAANGGSGATVTFTVSSGALSAITTTPAAGGSGYPASSTFNLAVQGGTGGIISATTNASGVITAFAAAPVVAGSGYSAGTNATSTLVSAINIPTSTVGGDDGELFTTPTYLGFVSEVVLANSGSGATVTFAVSSGAITTVTTTPAAGGSGYPANATFNLSVTGGGGTGGVVTATTNAAGVVVSFAAAPVVAGSGYSATVGAATAVITVALAPVGVVSLSQSQMVVTGPNGATINWMIVRAGLS